MSNFVLWKQSWWCFIQLKFMLCNLDISIVWALLLAAQVPFYLVSTWWIHPNCCTHLLLSAQAHSHASGQDPIFRHPVDVLHILNKFKLPVLSLHLLAACVSYCKVISYKKALQIDFRYKSGYAVSSTETRNNNHWSCF